MIINKTANGGYVVRGREGDADSTIQVFASIQDVTNYLLANEGFQPVTLVAAPVSAQQVVA